MMIADVGIVELQKVSDYRTVRRSLRISGIFSIFWGLVAITLGVSALRYSFINIFLIIIGLFLITTGILNIIAPTPIGIVIDGIALVTVGLWNIFISLINFSVGKGA